MKLKHLFLAFMLTSTIMHAQNIDGYKWTEIKYNVPPTTSVLSTVKNIAINSNNDPGRNCTPSIEQEINPEFYTIVDPTITGADLTIRVSSSLSTITSMNTTSSTQEKTDKNGKKYYETTFTTTGSDKITVTVEFFEASGNKLKGNTQTQTVNYTGSGSDKNSSINQFSTNKSKSITDTYRGLGLKAFHDLESEYLIAQQILNVNTLQIKSRKFDYSTINKAAEDAYTWLTGESTDLTIAPIADILKVYDTALQDLNIEDKKAMIDKEVGALCYYMKALIHFKAKDYTKAMEYITKSEELDKRLHMSQEAIKRDLTELQVRKAF